MQQAAQNMLNDLAYFNLVGKTKHGFKVSRLTIADLQDLAEAELMKVVRNKDFGDIPTGWHNAKVRLSKSISGFIVYTSDGYAINVSVTPFSVQFNGITWLSPNEFGGIVASMQASSGVSTEQALMRIQANRKYSSKAKQLVSYLNQLKLKGYTLQFLQTELSQGQALLNAKAGFLANER